MKISFSASELPDEGVVVVTVLEGRELGGSARHVDDLLSGRLVRAMELSRFKGKREQSLIIPAPADTRLDRIVIVGVGKGADITPQAVQAIGGHIYATLAPLGDKKAFVAVDSFEGSALSQAEVAAELAFGARLRAYRFDRYFTKQKEDDKPALIEVTFGCTDHSRAKRLYQPKDKVADAVTFTRDIVSEPANVIYPESLAQEAKSLEKLGVEVEILSEKDMKKLGMGALLGVGQGSERESQLVVMQWWGAGKPDSKEKEKSKEKKSRGDDEEDQDVSSDGPLAFIGKGVTFDTGGISIKPAASMEEMKWDMAGAGAVIGAIRALAAREAKVNAVGVVGLVENMPSGTAQRPGDVVTSMSGQTIEVINTDAEGRLVLADALWYTKKRFRPRLMIDLATLTGAIIIALGHLKAGLFSNNDTLAEQIAAAGAAVDEPVWRLPLGDGYDKLIKSDIADMKNVGDRSAGSISAAQFLQRFVGKTPWAHLDIAGVAWAKKDSGVNPKGATGFGVRLLDRLAADSFEGKV